MRGKKRIRETMLICLVVLAAAGLGQELDLKKMFQEGIPAFKLFVQVGLTKSGGEARRLIKQGGGYLNGNRLDSAEQEITSNDFNDMELILRAGKKRFHKIVLHAKKSN